MKVRINDNIEVEGTVEEVAELISRISIEDRGKDKIFEDSEPTSDQITKPVDDRIWKVNDNNHILDMRLLQAIADTNGVTHGQILNK